jgi:hypothetical protein
MRTITRSVGAVVVADRLVYVEDGEHQAYALAKKSQLIVHGTQEHVEVTFIAQGGSMQRLSVPTHSFRVLSDAKGARERLDVALRDKMHRSFASLHQWQQALLFRLIADTPDARKAVEFFLFLPASGAD